MATKSQKLKTPRRLVEEFRRLGTQGGKKRAKNVSAEDRRESARNAAQIRWAKAKKKRML